MTGEPLQAPPSAPHGEPPRAGVPNLGARAGVVAMLPFLPGVFVLGMVFGDSATRAGLAGWLAALMSSTVYSGASQFAALPLWSQGAVVLLTTLALSLRFSLMAASIRARLVGATAWQRATLAFFFTDESYAVAITRPGPIRLAFMLGAGGSLYAVWQVATVLGILWGPRAPSELAAPAQAIFPLAFLVLTILTCTTPPAACVALLAAVASAFGALALPAGWSVVLAGLAASLAGPLLERVFPARQA